MMFRFFQRGRDVAAVQEAEPAEARGAPAIEDAAAAGDAETRSGGPGVAEITQAANYGEWISFLGLDPADTAGETVTIERALTVPAFGSGVGFLSRTLAGLPCHVYERGADGARAKIEGHPVAALLNKAPNDDCSAFDWRRGEWQSVFTFGRGVSFIERNRAGEPINLWPLEVGKLRIERRAGRVFYHYRDTARRTVTYDARDVLDLRFMPASDNLAARSPVYMNATTLGLALAVTKYGRRFFGRGGVPPLSISGPFSTPASAMRAQADITALVQNAVQGGHGAIALPEGHSLTPIGVDPEKMQMEKLQRFLIEEVGRMLNLPAVFLNDLTHGRLNMVEQQDLQLVKHTLAHWVHLFEGEVNLKLFGRAPGVPFVKVSLDAILRGDLKSRAEAFARMISTGQLLPNEARGLDDRPPVEGGQVAYMQGAMAPIYLLAEGRGSGIGTGDPADGGDPARADSPAGGAPE